MRKAKDYMLKPKKVTRASNEAWWYANKRSIDVFTLGHDGLTVHVRIRRSDLLRYIEQTEKLERSDA